MQSKFIVPKSRNFYEKVFFSGSRNFNIFLPVSDCSFYENWGSLLVEGNMFELQW